MKILILIGLISILSADISNLSKNKQQLQELKREEILLNAKKQKDSWIRPLNFGATLSQSQSAMDIKSTNQDIFISFNQDIYRSGGIGYLIDYSAINKQLNLLKLTMENQNLNWELINTILSIKKEQILLAQSTLKLKNNDINIAIKKEKYEAGELDVTYLDNAIMIKNQQLSQHLVYQKSIQTKMVEFKQLSDTKLEKISLPNLNIMNQKKFLKDNLKLSSTKLNAKLKYQEYKITQSSYHPKISLNGKIGTQEYNSDDSRKNMSGEYYTVGVALTIPLDFNTNTNLQLSKIAYLKAKTQKIDTQKIELTKYDKFKINYQFFNKKIKLSKQNIKLQNKLITLTRREVKAGYKTSYDLKTLQNSKEIEIYEMKINKINQKLEVMKVYSLVFSG